MGLFADLWARLMWSLRTQTPVGGEWLGDQLRLLFPPDGSEPPEGERRLAILVSLDEWALELAPENYLGRLRTMVEAWVRRTTTQEVATAVRRFEDDAWLLDAVEQLKQRAPGSVLVGAGLVMLQGAFKNAGLITKPIYQDRFRLVVKVFEK